MRGSMPKPTKAEQEVAKYKSLLELCKVENERLIESYKVDRDMWTVEKGHLTQLAKGWEGMADNHLKKIMSHVCPTPEVKEVHVKGETVYRVPYWLLVLAIFVGWCGGVIYFYSHPRII